MNSGALCFNLPGSWDHHLEDPGLAVSFFFPKGKISNSDCWVRGNVFVILIDIVGCRCKQILKFVQSLETQINWPRGCLALGFFPITSQNQAQACHSALGSWRQEDQKLAPSKFEASLGYHLILLLIARINTTAKSNFGRKSVLDLQFIVSNERRPGAQGRNLESGTEEVMEEQLLLTGLISVAQWLAFLYNPDSLPRRWHHLQWTGSSYIKYQLRKCPKSLPVGNIMEAFSQGRFSLPRWL